MANNNIRRRPDGRWEVRVTTGYNPKNGNPIRRSIYCKTKAEAREKLTDLQFKLDHGEYCEPSRLTVGEWLDLWLERYFSSNKQATLVNYESHIRNQIKPGLGGIRLSKLTSEQIQDFYNSLDYLSPKSVKDIHGILHGALKQAVLNGHIPFNPADGGRVKLPKVQKPEIHPMEESKLPEFLDALHGELYEREILFALFTGCRRGEICGLTWDCVDFDKGTITIRQQIAKNREGVLDIIPTKTELIHTIMPAQSLMKILKEQRADQRKLRLAMGEAWQDRNFVFTRPTGQFVSPHTLYHHYKRIVASIGLPELRLHDLRHTFATLSIRAGDDLKTVQNNLGHSTITTTMNTYAHVTDEMKKASADRMENFISGVRRRAD